MTYSGRLETKGVARIHLKGVARTGNVTYLLTSLPAENKNHFQGKTYSETTTFQEFGSRNLWTVDDTFMV